MNSEEYNEKIRALAIDFIEEVLPMVQALEDKFSRHNDFVKMSNAKRIMEQLEEELQAARLSWDAWANYIETHWKSEQPKRFEELDQL